MQKRQQVFTSLCLAPREPTLHPRTIFRHTVTSIHLAPHMPPTVKRSLAHDFSLAAVIAGFVTVLVGYTSSAVIVFQAAHAMGATQQQAGSWMWALGMGMAITCIGLSLRYRMPVVTAWSTPGAAMLVAAAASVPLSDAIGAFILVALFSSFAGFSGLFERLMRHIPISLASGMLAGVLLRFGLDVFVSMQTQLLLSLAMFATYLFGRRMFARYAVVATLIVGMAIAHANGLMQFESVQLKLAQPQFTMPTLSFGAVFGIALPLFLVTMASQNMPGVAVIRASGFQVPISPTVGWIGIVNTVLAPFGAFALNLAAITAAICMGRDAHEDPLRRYVAALSAGGFYLLTGLFGATVAALLAALPRELVMAIAGIALLATIGSSLTAALKDEREREPALITFMVTASGMTLAGIGSAFWGLFAGGLAVLVLRKKH